MLNLNQYKLSNQFINRLKGYLASENFTDVNDVSASSYWQYHLDNMDVRIEGDSVAFGSKSGDYTPIQTSNAKGRLPVPKIVADFKKAINTFRRGYSLLTYPEAFDRVMNHDPIADIYLSSERINFEKLKENPIIRTSVSDIRRRFFAKEKYNLNPNLVRNAHMIRAYYYFNIIMGMTKLPDSPVVFEIGAGNGNLTSTLYSELKNATMIICDLPKTLCLSSVFLSDLFPQAKMCLPHEFHAEIAIKDYDFVLITPQQTQLLKDNSVDLSMNTASFHEMTQQQIGEYIELIQRISVNEGYFFNTNRVEKIPSLSDTGDYDYLKTEVKEPVNRFTDYPWNLNNTVLVNEVCRLIRLVGLDDYFIRLERIHK